MKKMYIEGRPEDIVNTPAPQYFITLLLAGFVGGQAQDDAETVKRDENKTIR